MLVITRKNPVHSALALILTLLCVAGLYLMLYAPFVAGVQIILYVGGIMVLFLFVIMLVNLERSEKEKQFNQQWLPGILAALGLGTLFVLIYIKGKNVFPALPRCLAGGQQHAASRQSCCTATTCSRSKSRRCCCLSRSSGRW